MAATAATVRVSGLTETIRAFQRLQVGIDKEIKAGLKKAAEPVAADARGRISRYRGASTATIKPYVSMKGAVVRQSTSKRGGKHPGFGSLQMGHLIAALEDNESEVIDGVEDLLDFITRAEGF